MKNIITAIVVLFLVLNVSVITASASCKGFKECSAMAKRGDAEAQFNLGNMYYKGQGVLQDYKQAVKWYRLAADQGNAAAQFNLGVSYDNGQGVLQDYKQAVKWYRLAADQGNAAAQFNLGVSYYKGQGVPKNYINAHMWINISASNGNENAAKARDEIVKEMTAAQISKAQQMARKCIASGYKKCD